MEKRVEMWDGGKDRTREASSGFEHSLLRGKVPEAVVQAVEVVECRAAVHRLAVAVGVGWDGCESVW